MNCFCSIFLGLAAWLTSLAVVYGDEAKTPRTDLYGDPLPPGAVARLGTIRLRHADADVIFSKDGKQLISCGSDGEVRFWDVATGKLLQRKRLKIPLSAEIERTALSANGVMAAIGSRETVRLYEAKTDKEIGRLATAKSDVALTFSPNGQFLALQIDDGQNELILQVWNTNPFKRGRTCGQITSSPVTFTADGKRIAGIGPDEKIRIWDTATGKEILDSSECTETPGPALAFSPDGKVLAVGSKSNGIVRLLDAGLLKTTSILKPPANVKAHFIDWLVFAPDGRHLAGAYHEDSDAPFPEEYGLLVWDTAGDKQARRIPERYGTRMRFAPNGKTLACWDAATGEIRLWDVASGRPLQRWPEHGCCVEALTISSDGKILASCDNTGRLCLWDVAAGKLGHARQGSDGWMGTPFCLFLPDDKQIITASLLGAIQVWDVNTGKEVRRWQTDPHEWGMLAVHAIGLCEDGKRAAAFAWVQNSQSMQRMIWDTATGKQLSFPSSHRKMHFQSILNQSKLALKSPSDFAFAPDGESATVWLGKRVGVEEVSSGALLASLPEDVGGPIVFSPDGRRIAAAVLEKRFRLNAADHEEMTGISLIETVTGEEVLRLECGVFEYAAFTPDGRGLVVMDAKKLRVWDTMTGKRLHEMTWPREAIDGRREVKVCSLAVLPDGRAATGMRDGDILLWDLEPAKWPSPRAVHDLDNTKCAALWSDLAGRAGKAHRAIAALAASPTQAVAFLKDRLQSVALDAMRIEQLVADLDSDSFAKRDSASRELIRMRYRADAAMQRALKAKPSLELRHRLEAILAEPKRAPAEAVRMLRTIAVLERIGTPEARRILEKSACGAASSESRAAQAALRRLKQRAASVKEGSAP